jgi:hypothetical protein
MELPAAYIMGLEHLKYPRSDGMMRRNAGTL